MPLAIEVEESVGGQVSDRLPELRLVIGVHAHHRLAGVDVDERLLPCGRYAELAESTPHQSEISARGRTADRHAQQADAREHAHPRYEREAHAVAVAAAAAGVVLISEALSTPFADLEKTGIALALLAGAFWAAYIVLAGRTGGEFPKLEGLALARDQASGWG